METLGQDLNEEEDLPIGEDSRDREGLAQGTSDISRGVEPNIHGIPMASTPFQENRAPSSRISKRRRLLTSADAVQFCEEPSQSANAFDSLISPLPDMEINISSIVSPDRPVSPDRSAFPDRSVLPDGSVSPDNSVLPVRPVSPDWSASPVAAITGAKASKKGTKASKKGAEVQLKRVGEGTQIVLSHPQLYQIPLPLLLPLFGAKRSVRHHVGVPVRTRLLLLHLKTYIPSLKMSGQQKSCQGNEFFLQIFDNRLMAYSRTN